MNSPMNDDTQEKARDLARKITVAHDLDPEIQEELYGHIEDKLLAYKSGEERISDEDAFILVREHFGDAKVIRGLMQEVHAEAVQVGMLRKILVAAITTLVSLQVASWLLYGTGVVLRSVASADRGTQTTLAYSLLTLVCLIPWICFTRWKVRLRRSEVVWFSSWRTGRLGLLCLGVFGTSLVVPGGFALLRVHEAATGEFLQLSQHSIFAPGSLWGLVVLAGAALLSMFSARAFLSGRSFSTGIARVAIPFLCAMGTWATLVLVFATSMYSAGAWYGTLYWRVETFGRMLVEVLDMAGLSATGVFWMGLSLTLCASWVWWCDGHSRQTRNVFRATIAWMSLVALHTTMPWLHTGIVFDGDHRLLRSGASISNARIPGLDVWFYLNWGSQERFFDLPRVTTDFAMLLLVVLFIVATFKIPRRDCPSGSARILGS